MALSNWFIVAWDEKGNNILEMPYIKKNTWSNFQGYRVEVYKNWIYLFPLGDKPENKRIMTIHSGDIEAGKFFIKAKRGLQNSVYAIIEWSSGKGNNYKLHRIFAIGGYGFKPDTPHLHTGEEDDIEDKWVGCLPETVEDFKQWVDRTLNPELFGDMESEINIIMQIDPTITREQIIKNLKDNRKVIPFKHAISQNQGDIYFHKRLGLPKQLHKVGEKAPKNYFGQMLDKWKKPKEV